MGHLSWSTVGFVGRSVAAVVETSVVDYSTSEPSFGSLH